MSQRPPPSFRGVFHTDEAARAVYSEAAGIARAWPAAVAVPVDSADVQCLVRWARDAGLALIPRGSGSGMAGGAIGDGVVVDLSRLRDLEPADVSQRFVRAGAGVLRGELDRAASAVGLQFPVDPSSGEFCTVGGMVATNAAGPRTLRYGPTRRWVRALECVFDDGSVATVRRGEPPPDVPALRRFRGVAHQRILDAPPHVLAHASVRKDSSGYAVGAYRESRDLVDLLTGSEGTLVMIAGVELALAPGAGSRDTLLLAFDDLDQAVEAAIAAREAGATACELLDRTFLDLARTSGNPLPAPEGSEAVLLVAVEGTDDTGVGDAAAAIRSGIAPHRPTRIVQTRVGDDGTDLWAFRHAASPALARLDARLKSMQFIEDAAVPSAALTAYVRGVRRILAREATRGVIFGHAGDAHLHVNPLVDVSDTRWRERVHRILTDVTDLVAELGGTLTGEHGDGRLRAPLLGRVWSAETLALFAIVKQAFDPDGLFNPGAKVPRPGQPAIGDVKYDPMLPPLPSAARRALDLVERERAYSRLRLDLL